MKRTINFEKKYFKSRHVKKNQKKTLRSFHKLPIFLGCIKSNVLSGLKIIVSVYPESSVVVNQQVPNMYPAPMTTTVVLQQPQQAPGKLVCNREGHRGWSSGMFACGDDVTNCTAF
jgi:hypothetical protein